MDGGGGGCVIYNSSVLQFLWEREERRGRVSYNSSVLQFLWDNSVSPPPLVIDGGVLEGLFGGWRRRRARCV